MAGCKENYGDCQCAKLKSSGTVIVIDSVCKRSALISNAALDAGMMKAPTPACSKLFRGVGTKTSVCRVYDNPQKRHENEITGGHRFASEKQNTPQARSKAMIAIAAFGHQ